MKLICNFHSVSRKMQPIPKVSPIMIFEIFFMHKPHPKNKI